MTDKAAAKWNVIRRITRSQTEETVRPVRSVRVSAHPAASPMRALPLVDVEQRERDPEPRGRAPRAVAAHRPAAVVFDVKRCAAEKTAPRNRSHFNSDTGGFLAGVA